MLAASAVTAAAPGSLVLIVGIALLLVFGSSPAGAEAEFIEIDQAARDAVAAGDVRGVVVLVGRDDRIVYQHAWGSRAPLPSLVPMTVDTVFDLRSLTKPFATTLAILTLVERGLVQLDAPLGRYLPEFRHRRFEHVTIARILTHSAGFAPGATGLPLPGGVRALAGRSLDYPPGTDFQYSDVGFVLLSEVVRRVSREPLVSYVRRTLFRPLGLRDTTFDPSEPMRERVARADSADPSAPDGALVLFSTAGDLARLCRMMLNKGALDGRRVLSERTLKRLWRRGADADGRPALGWDMSSWGAPELASFLPPNSLGHTGFSGHAVWMDRTTRTYMILLTNQAQRGAEAVDRTRDLFVRVAAAVGAALFSPAVPPSLPSTKPTDNAARPWITPPHASGIVRSGLDVLVAKNFTPYRGRTVGLVANHTSVDRGGQRAVDLFASAPGVRVGAVFSPEHGFTGQATTDVAHGRDAQTGVPIWSLYGVTQRPTTEMLRGVNVLVFDIQDVGVRFYTYLTTLVYVMEEAGRRGIPVTVLDRPNPITGRVVEGPVMDSDLRSFMAPHPLPVRTGLTVGEFARLVVAERKLPVALTVVPMDGWDRSRWYDDTGLPWINPSPNIRSVTQALLYSGIGLLEGTNISVGRGTDTPFEIVGAPWIDAQALIAALNGERLAGIRFDAVAFTPTDDIHAGTMCHGVRLTVTDREAIRPVTIALAMARAMRLRHRDLFRPENIQLLLAHRATIFGLLRDNSLDGLLGWAGRDTATFMGRRAPHLLYP